MSNASPTPSSSVIQAELTVGADQPGSVIQRNVYGHFAEHLGRGIYEGIWVGESSTITNVRGIRSDVVTALKRLRVPVLRWPGGCFADEYHWKDGVGPRDRRPKMVNTHWGGVVENNHFGTHEFMDLCEQLGAEPYVCGNVGSGTPQEMMEWVEYMTSDADSPMANWRRQNGRTEPWRLQYFGVGNESWGCGGTMRPEFYADNYRRYNTFVKNYAGNRVQRIACGAVGFDTTWTDVLMNLAGRHMDALSLHWYSVAHGNWAQKGSATEFSEAQWHATLFQAFQMEELMRQHSAVMDKYDPERRVGLAVDEWGTWFDVEPGTNPGFLYQQNTLRDALVAALTLNVFNRNAARVTMANIAQTVNVLQAMILTSNEQLLLTPTYHVFEMYAVHQGATSIPLALDTPAYELDGASLPSLHASASRDGAGRLHVSIANLEPSRAARVVARGLEGALSGRVLTAPALNAHNTFAAPNSVVPAPFDGILKQEGGAVLTLPAKSVVVLEAQ